MNSITFALLRFVGKVPVMTKREEISSLKVLEHMWEFCQVQLI